MLSEVIKLAALVCFVHAPIRYQVGKQWCCTMDKQGLESSSLISASSASFIASSVAPELRRLDSEFVFTESISSERERTHDDKTVAELHIDQTRICLTVSVNALGAEGFATLSLLPSQALTDGESTQDLSIRLPGFDAMQASEWMKFFDINPASFFRQPIQLGRSYSQQYRDAETSYHRPAVL